MMRSSGRLVLWGVLLAGFALRVHELGALSLWMDEAFSVFGSRPPVAQALANLLADGVHPPLFYFVQRLSYLFGVSEFALRWPAAMMGVLGIAAIARLARDWWGRRASLLAGLLLALSPFAVWYGREARMYSMLLLLTLGVMRAFEVWMRGGGLSWRMWAAFVSLSAAAYTTHYFALMLPLTQLAFILLTFRQTFRHLRAWSLVQLLAAVPLALWVAALYAREGRYFGIGWIHPAAWSDPLLTLQNFLVGYGPEAWRWIATAGMGAVAAFGVWRMARTGEQRDRALLLGLWIVLPIVATFLVSLRRPTYVDRLLIGSLPALLLALAYGLRSLRESAPAWAGVAAIGIATAALAVGVWGLLDRKAYAREDWHSVGEYIQTAERTGDALLLRSLYYRLPFDYYYRGALEPAGMDAGWTPGEERGRVWLVYRGRLEDAHRFAHSLPPDFARDEQDADIRRWLEAMNPHLMERRDFPGVAVMLYDLSPQH